ncbi:MAG: hypothetical protein ACQEVA_15145 [Myxococcota bacterium]
MHRILITAVLAAGLFFPTLVYAQDDGEAASDMRARVQKDAKLGVTVHRPDGWVFGKPGKGVVALLTAAGDSQSQIEVRVSEHVKEEHRQPFFASFHANIQKSGFDKVDAREDVTYGDKEGAEVEYKTGNDENAFRLVVWQYHQGEKAFLVVGFFPEEARSVQYKDFQAVCEKIEIEKK